MPKPSSEEAIMKGDLFLNQSIPLNLYKLLFINKARAYPYLSKNQQEDLSTS
jgi:hypothetical protein